MKKLFLIYIASLTILSCGSSKQENEVAQLAITKELIESGKYQVIQHEAEPMLTNELNQLAASGLLMPGNVGNSIFLPEKSDYIVINDAIVEADLAYYGEIRLALNRNNISTIQIEKQDIIDYVVTFDEKKNKYSITFNARNQAEFYDVTIEVYPNSNTITTITSAHRNSIRYRGTLKAISLDKENT